MEMMEKLRALDLHYADVEARLSAPETYEDPALVARLNKEQRELEPVVMAYRAYQRRRQDLEDAEALMGDPDMKELAQEEYQQAREELALSPLRRRCSFPVRLGAVRRCRPAWGHGSSSGLEYGRSPHSRWLFA